AAGHVPPRVRRRAGGGAPAPPGAAGAVADRGVRALPTRVGVLPPRRLPAPGRHRLQRPRRRAERGDDPAAGPAFPAVLPRRSLGAPGRRGPAPHPGPPAGGPPAPRRDPPARVGRAEGDAPLPPVGALRLPVGRALPAAPRRPGRG